MRRMVRCLWFGALAAWLALAGCRPAGQENPDVIVLHTGRLRGNVFPLELQAAAPLQHYPYLAGYVKAVREEARRKGAQVLLIDLGDSLSGSFAAHVTHGANMAEFFNALGYDAIVLSNLDFAAGPDLLKKIQAPVLNPFANAHGQPATEGTVFSAAFRKGELDVGLACNFYGDVSPAEHPDRFPVWFGSTREGVQPLRGQPSFSSASPGSLHLLTWMKFESPEKPPEEFLKSLREAGVHAILAHRIYGGSQRESWAQSGVLPWNPPVSMNILRDNRGFAVARLDLKREGGRWKVLSQQIIPMTANTAPADPEIVAAIAKFREVIAAADKQVANLATAMTPDQILNAYFEALLGVPGTEAAVYSRQSIRSDWPAGPLRASAVFNALPWTTPLLQAEVPREALRQAAAGLGLELRWKEVPEAEEQEKGGTVRVTTSEFFWRLLSARMGIPANAATPAGAPSEFDFFVENLERGVGLPAQNASVQQ